MPALPSRLALDVRQATHDDLDAVGGLLHQAYDGLLSRGVTDQWVQPFRRENIAQLIDNGEVYIAIHDGDPTATFTLTYNPDPELWGEPPDDAGYIRRLAVDREHAGREIGARLLDHAAEIVAATGRPWLRLDCAKYNTRLHNYYRSHGFTPLKTVDLPHRQSGALFERPTSSP